GMMGISAWQIKDQTKAGKYLDAAIKGGSKDPKVLLYAGYVRAGAGDHKGAITALTSAETAGEKEPELFLVRGKSYYAENNHTAAIADLKKVETNFSGDVDVIEKLALAHIALKKDDDAFSYLEKALKLNTTNKDVLFQSGNARFRKNDFTGAIDSYDRAIKAGANDEIIYNNR